jgi:hypothetical protein
MTQVRLIIVASLIFVTLISNANPTVITAPCADDADVTCAVGIDNLDVMGMRFDVVYILDSYNLVFETSAPFFLGNEAGAHAARDAIISAQNGIGGIFGAIGQGNFFTNPIFPGNSEINIPYFTDGFTNDISYALIQSPSSDIWLGGSLSGFPNDHVLNGPEFYDSFAVFSKLSAETQLERLDTAVTGEGSGDSLAGKIELAQAYLAVPDVESACGMLNAFRNQVRAQRGKKLSVELADQLTADAQALISEVGCD